MAGKQAKILSDANLDDLLAWCTKRRYPERDRVVVLLSVKAGLRAMEVAKIQRRHVTDASGQVDQVIHLENKVCKKGRGRPIPMNPMLREAIADLLATSPGRAPQSPLVRSERALREDPDEPGTGKVQAMHARSIGRLFACAYADLGLEGCSSHSGRRTFITKAARKVVELGGSLRDVQQLAGHASLSQTQTYIEGDSDVKRRLVALI